MSSLFWSHLVFTLRHFPDLAILTRFPRCETLQSPAAQDVGMLGL